MATALEQLQETTNTITIEQHNINSYIKRGYKILWIFKQLILITLRKWITFYRN